MFNSAKEVQDTLEKEKYICSTEIATMVHLSQHLQKPLLVEGPAGVGKTELAKALAASQDMELIRLQCYEGLDETKALYEWEYSKQLLYTQILKDKISEALQLCKTLTESVEFIANQENAFFSSRFILPRPLLKAILSEKQCVLLIDEIDKSDPEFEAFLLEMLSDFQVSVPELGTLRAKHIPQVILTSNDSRDMSDGLKRRCLHLFMDYPDPSLEAQIIKRKVPGLDENITCQIVNIIKTLRGMDLKKQPSISETLDWAQALVILNADKLSEDIVKSTLNTFIKYQSDMEKVLNNRNSIFRLDA